MCLINLFFVGTIIKCRNESEFYALFNNEDVTLFFFFILGRLTNMFRFDLSYTATYGAPKGLRHRGVKASTIFIIIGHAFIGLFLNTLLALRMHIGEEGDPKASSFSWFTGILFVIFMYFTAFCSMMYIYLVCLFRR